LAGKHCQVTCTFRVARKLQQARMLSSLPLLYSWPSQNRTSGFPTSGSSWHFSVCLRSTTWVQVFTDSRLRPPHPG
jgi:hypothetical protein